ncbi:MAG: GNAT family N-acetyltransferase [Chitinophagaceae bacterium]|nr:GNAT family N-acetyltransferase [Anaerolineae bacterium]
MMKDTGNLYTKRGTLNIRQASPDDTQAFYGVLKNVSEWLDQQHSTQWVPSAHDNNISLVQQIIQDGTCYVVEDNIQIIATIRLNWELPYFWNRNLQNVGYISTLYVHRNFAGNGIGVSMMNWAEHLIKSMDKEVSCLDCYAKSNPLCCYYEHIGYISVGEVETYPAYRQRLYEKQL